MSAEINKKTNVKKYIGFAAIALLLSAALICCALLIRGKASPTAAKNGLSAYELAVESGFSGSIDDWLNSLSGASAYEIALSNGYEGSESDWLSDLRLRGEQGVGVRSAMLTPSGELHIILTDGTDLFIGKIVGAGIASVSLDQNGELIMAYSDGRRENLGKIVGAAGKSGENGLSAYELALSAGATDEQTEAAWLESLKGGDGLGIESIDISGGSLYIALTDGTKLDLGDIRGERGQDGVGIASAALEDEMLRLAFSNGEAVTLGPVVGERGEQGVGVDSVNITDTGALTVVLTNGVRQELGNIRGENGIGISRSELTSDGVLRITYSNGETVDAGRINFVKTVTLSTDGELQVTLNDNSVVPLGSVKGEKGEKGDKGDAGAKGEAGRGIAGCEFVDGRLKINYTDGTSEYIDIQDDRIENELSLFCFDPAGDGLSVRLDPAFKESVLSLSIPAEHEGKPEVEIAADGFAQTTNLSKIYIPDSVKKIGARAFIDCKKLRTVRFSETLAEIGASAFYGCGIEGELTLPDSLTTLGGSAFYGCAGVTRVLSLGSITDTGTQTFEKCVSLREIALPDCLLKINARCFEDCALLKSITVPRSVTEIGYLAFRNCPLERAVFENPTGWGYYYSSAADTTALPDATMQDPAAAAKQLLGFTPQELGGGYGTLYRSFVRR